MERHDCETVDACRGRIGLARGPNAGHIERENYLRVLQSW
jgi:hypothetical protein